MNRVYDDLFRLKGVRSRSALVKQFIVDRTFRFIVYLRKYQFCKSIILKKYFELKYRKFRDKYGIEIPFSVNIGTGLLMIHPYNITINRDSIIGNNFTILKGATVGNSKTGNVGTPTIGDDCYLGINSTIVGNVVIGNRVLIASNTFVNFDVPDDSVVIGSPGIIHNKKDASLPYITNRVNIK